MADFDPFSSGVVTAEAAPVGSPATPGVFDPFKAGLSTQEGPNDGTSPLRDPMAKWRNLYDGLDAIDRRVDGPQRQAFAAMDRVVKDPQEARARAVNQSFVADHYGLHAPWVGSNWDAVKSSIAEKEFGTKDAAVDERWLYGKIAERMGAGGKGEQFDRGEIKAWTWRDTFASDVGSAARSAKAFWDSINRPAKELPNPPDHLPDVWFSDGMGTPINPAVYAGVYKGAVKPLIESLESPLGIATLGAGVSLKALAKTSPVAKAALAGMSGAFAALMGYSAAKATPDAIRTALNPQADTQEKVAALSGVAGTATLAVLGTMSTAFDLLPDKGAKIAGQMEGKGPTRAAQILRKEAVTASPDVADALHRAATSLDEVGAHERGPDAWQAKPPVASERIAAAAVRAPDGTVSEGMSHVQIAADRTGAPVITTNRDGMWRAASADGMVVMDGLKDEAEARRVAASMEGGTTPEKVQKVGEALAGAQEGFVTDSGRFVDREEARSIAEQSGQLKNQAADYQGIHRPQSDGPRAFNLLETDLAARDVYDHPEWYTGQPESKAIKQTIRVLKSIRGNPDADVTIFRASPRKELNAGDWVALSEEYAKQHGMADDPAEDVPIHSFKVKAKDIRWPGDELGEFGYYPEDLPPPEGKPATDITPKVETPAAAPKELQSHEVEMTGEAWNVPRGTFGQTSLKNAYGELERAAYGFEDAPPSERRAMAERWALSGEIMAENPEAGRQMAERLAKNPNIGLTDDQSALLLRHKVGLQNALNEAADIGADPNSSPELRAEANSQVKELSDQLVKLLDAVNRRGAEWGREGRWRQALAREDYSFAAQETLLRAAKGGAELTDAEREGLQARVKALEAAQARYEAKIAELTAEPRTVAADRAVREMAKPPMSPRRFKAAQALRDRLHEKAEESKKFLFQSGRLFAAGPDTLYHLSVIGADQIYSTGLDFAEWSAAMVKDLGEKVRPLLAEAWDASRKLFHQENRNALLDELRALSAEERTKRLSPIAQELARAKIEQGVKGRDAVVDAVWVDLKEAVPGVTRRDTMDAVSGYGQFKLLSHDEITDQLRDIKGQLQQVAKLEDMARGEAPKKTGVERRTPSDEERRLQQQVEAKKKEGGYAVTDPERQLRTALQSVKTRLTNQIKDLEKQIETREKIVREKKTVALDGEAKALAERRDELKAEFERVFGRPELSYEQRLNIWKAGARKRLSELEERLANKDFEPKPKRPLPLDPEAFRLKSQIERIRQDFWIERTKAEEAAQPKWFKALRTTSDMARAGAISGYHTLGKLATFSLARFSEAPVYEVAGGALRQIPGVREIAAKANMEAGAEVRGLARFYTKAATAGMRDALDTLKSGKSELKAELGDARHNAQPVHWYDYFGILHMAEKSPLLRGDFELRLEKVTEWSIANGLDVEDPMVAAAIRKDAFDYSQRAILMENNALSTAINSFTRQLEAANPKTGKVDVTKAALSWFVKTFLTKGIVKTPANYVAQTIARTPLGLAKGTAQLVVAHIKGIDKLTPEEANAIMRLLKVGAVGSAVFVWGAVDASKDPKDRMFGGYYQPGDKRSEDDVGFGRIRVGGVEFPHILTHNPLTESGQMGSTFYRVMKSRMSKAKGGQEKGVVAGAAASLAALASEAPIVSPITREVSAMERGEANKLVWDELNGLIPMFFQNLAADLDSNKSRKPETLGQAIELGVPGMRQNVPETKAQKKRDIRERLKQ